MSRNTIESYFRSSKMATGSHFVKIYEKIKLCIDLKCREMRSKVKFRSSKLATMGHFVKKNQKIKVVYLSEMVRNAINSDFRYSKMAAGGHFAKNIIIYKKKSWREMRTKLIFSHP